VSLLKRVITFPCSRGDGGALYLQPATAGVMFCPGYAFVKLPPISDVDVRVLRNGNPWTVSGRERSSTKRNLPCAARAPGSS